MSRELPGGDLVSLDLQAELERQGDDEDPPCQCWQITEDIADASFCLVHGKPTPELMPTPTPSDQPDSDVAF